MDAKSKSKEAASTFAAPTVVSALQDHRIRAVCCGAEHTCALSDVGLVLTWGAGLGQLGHAFEASAHTPRIVATLKGVRIHSVASGSMHSVVIDASGKLWTWGRGVNGQLGLGDTINHQPQPACIDGLATHKFTQVACGMAHTIAVTDAGDVFTWGWGRGGQLGHGNEDTIRLPRLVDALRGKKIRAVAAGVNFSVALSDAGIVFFWGTSPASGTDGGSGGDVHLLPMVLESFSSKGVLAVAAGGHHLLALSHTGDVWAWGAGVRGQLGTGDRKSRSTPALIKALHGHSICQVSCGLAHSAAVTDTGEVWSWGASSGSHARDALIPRPVQGLSDKGIHFVACGWSHSAAVTFAGSVYTWGIESEHGMLGHHAVREAAVAETKADKVPFLPERTAQTAGRPRNTAHKRNGLSKSTSLLIPSNGSSSDSPSSCPVTAHNHSSSSGNPLSASIATTAPSSSSKSSRFANLARHVQHGNPQKAAAVLTEPEEQSEEITMLSKKLKNAEFQSKRSTSLVIKLRKEIKELREQIDADHSGAKNPKTIGSPRPAAHKPSEIEELKKQVSELTQVIRMVTQAGVPYAGPLSPYGGVMNPMMMPAGNMAMMQPQPPVFSPAAGQSPRRSGPAANQPWLSPSLSPALSDDLEPVPEEDDDVRMRPVSASVTRSTRFANTTSNGLTMQSLGSSSSPPQQRRPASSSSVMLRRAAVRNRERDLEQDTPGPQEYQPSSTSPTAQHGDFDDVVVTDEPEYAADERSRSGSLKTTEPSWEDVIRRVQVAPNRPRSAAPSASIGAPSPAPSTSSPARNYRHMSSNMQTEEPAVDPVEVDSMVKEDIQRQRELSRANHAETVLHGSPARVQHQQPQQAHQSPKPVEPQSQSQPQPQAQQPQQPQSSAVPSTPAASQNGATANNTPADQDSSAPAGGNSAARQRWNRVRNVGVAAAKLKHRKSGALHRAAAAEKPQLVSQLLQRGLDPEEEDEEGRTPLHSACAANAFSSARVLLEEGHADTNAVDDAKRTALHLAAAVSVELCVLLLNNSAEVKRRDDTGATALHYAALAGWSDACAVLLERGADVDDKDDLGRTALHLAVHAGQESVVARLVDEFEASVATRDAAGCSPLHYAASAGDLGCLKFLIMRGAVVSAEDAKGAQATHFAAGEGHAQVLKELISPDVGGADALAVDKRGRSALHYAAIKGAADCVKVLLSGMGVEINRRDDAGWTALHYAYREGHAEVFDVLMDAGADPSELYRIQRKASAPIERRIEASSDQSRPQQQPGDSKKKNDSKACVVM